MCFFEEWGPLFAGASNVGREERSRKESDDTSYDVFVGRFETSVFESRGSDVVKPIWLLMTMWIVPPVP